jgi:hypothetical protein
MMNRQPHSIERLRLAAVWIFEKQKMSFIMQLNSENTDQPIGSSPNGSKPPVVGSTVILGDCVQLMKGYADNYFDLAVVDPPYEGNDAIDLKNNNNFRKQATKRKVYHLFEKKNTKDEYYYKIVRVSTNTKIWGGNNY